MTMIPIVENPRRRRSRRLTTAQLAAGFGGKRHMSKRSYRKRGRRRNPDLAALALNPRRRRRSSKSSRYGVRRLVYRRNPGFLGGLTNMIDFKGATYVAGGIIAAKAGPNLVRKLWAGAPVEGIGAQAVRLATVLALATGVRYFLGSSQGAQQFAAGGLGYVLYDLANTYVLPQVGLSGLTAESDYVTTAELENLSGYQPSRALMGYQPTGMQPELAS